MTFRQSLIGRNWTSSEAKRCLSNNFEIKLTQLMLMQLMSMQLMLVQLLLAQPIQDAFAVMII